MANPKNAIHWDEDNIAANDTESLQANRMKITEPKTPFHYIDGNDQPEAFPPRAPAAVASGERVHDNAFKGLEAALVAKALERREEEPADDEEEHARKFAASRSDHYKIGKSMAELRKLAAEAMDEEEEDDEEPGRMPDVVLVRNRPELFAHLHAAAVASNAADPIAAVRLCMTAYAPPAERLIIRSEADLAKLGTSAAAIKAAADPTFWAYSDFNAVLSSFSLDPSDKERRVMGIEGVGSMSTLHKVLASGQQVLHIGHLSLLMMEGKVASGEWRWLDEGGCSMHTATNKPALLRAELRAKLGLEIKVVRHDKNLAGSNGSEEEVVESEGDLIIFDMNYQDVTTEVGNTKVFCQASDAFTLGGLDTLLPPIRQALELVLERELKTTGFWFNACSGLCKCFAT